MSLTGQILQVLDWQPIVIPVIKLQIDAYEANKIVYFDVAFSTLCVDPSNHSLKRLKKIVTLSFRLHHLYIFSKLNFFVHFLSIHLFFFSFDMTKCSKTFNELPLHFFESYLSYLRLNVLLHLLPIYMQTNIIIPCCDILWGTLRVCLEKQMTLSLSESRLSLLFSMCLL